MRSSVTVLIDSREQVPLLFPETFLWFPDRVVRNAKTIRIKKKTLPMVAGDYALEHREKYVIIERKGSPRELWGNLFTKDRSRFVRAMDKLVSSCERPILLLDFRPGDFYRPMPHVKNPERVADELWRMVTSYNLNFRLEVIFAGDCKATKARRNLGELMVRRMLALPWT